MSSGTVRLSLENISVCYPGMRQAALDGFSLDLLAGEIICLLGSSGSGKSTALRAIAGFETLSAGRIQLDGKPLISPAEQRGIGLMFQDYALFPHLSVVDNIAFGLRHLAAATRRQRVEELINLVGLQTQQQKYPHQLSGGQQQRVALARALAPAPKLMLLDEPFSNLDSDTRAKLMHEAPRLFKALGCAVIMVTHDQQEAFAIADRVGVLSNGRLLQLAQPELLYTAPSHRLVAELVGQGDWLRAETLGLNETCDIRLRPGQLQLDLSGTLLAQLEAHWFVGPHHVARLRFDSGESVVITLQAAEKLPAASRIALRLSVDPQTLLRFPRQT